MLLDENPVRPPKIHSVGLRTGSDTGWRVERVERASWVVSLCLAAWRAFHKGDGMGAMATTKHAHPLLAGMNKGKPLVDSCSSEG